MANKIDIEQWLEKNEDKLIDGNTTDSDLGDQVEVNNENTDMENGDILGINENESVTVTILDQFDKINGFFFFFGKDKLGRNI